ncbi:MAG: helix-turn-helix transcriptional regulator [Lachnospiraceae bacterium]|nr:helix-turn-helix transcriptional regulator [Lachnospiraceae bacterium]
MKTNAPSRKKNTVPVIDMQATGHNICVLREKKRMSVKALQEILGFDTPQAIYKWQRGITLPSIDNLVALAIIFETTIDSILVLEDVNVWKLRNMEQNGK